MIYALSIDWLTIFCVYAGDGLFAPIDSERFSYKKEPFGTRCFSSFYRVRSANAEGGWDDFAEIQAHPYPRNVLPDYAVMIRFCNRTLYLPEFWTLADEFLRLNLLGCNGISRIDICADFNDFATMSPLSLIEGFAAKKYRHIGRGIGSLYFNHGVGVERDEFAHTVKDYGVQYTGLTFGTHASDAHVYLYNKSYELATQGDKPWIRDIWTNIGLDVRNVWRLEVSVKSKGLKFKDKKTGKIVEVDVASVYDTSELDRIYQTFVKKLFSFIRNKHKISNVSREPRLVLFDDKPAYDRGTIRNISVGGRMERILIKSLHQFADTYRGYIIGNAKESAEKLAECLAYATGLHGWYDEKKEEWEKPIHK